MNALSKFPKEIWEIIFKSLGDNLYDIIRFKSVCSLFRLIGSKNVYCLSSPFLFIPRSSVLESHDLFSLGDRKRAYPIVIPELDDRLCLGSFYGWLFTVDFISAEIGLLNPMNKAMLSLPPLSSFTDLDGIMDTKDGWRYYFKATICADPVKGKGFIAIFCSSDVLSFCRLGDSKWSTLVKGEGRFEDVIQHMGKFYAIDFDGRIVCWDKCASNAPFKTIIKSSNEFSQQRFLVNSPGGELLIVNVKGCGGAYYSVLKLDKERNRLLRLERLDGDEALFLSRPNSICVSTLGYSHYSANRIYYTDHSQYNVCEYNLEDGSMKRIYSLGTTCTWTGAVWITPTPKKSLHIITKTKKTTKSDPPSMAMTGSKVRRGRKT